jgi:hypothetical protein
MEDPYAELPLQKHKSLQQVQDAWLDAAHELENDPSLARRQRIYGKAVIRAVEQMPHNTPARRSILQWCADNVKVKDVARDFGVSLDTVYAAINDERNFLMNLKYTPGVKRKRVDDAKMEVAMAYMNDQFPLTSGREFRVINLTYDYMYVSYYYYCLDREVEPMWKT